VSWELVGKLNTEPDPGLVGAVVLCVAGQHLLHPGSLASTLVLFAVRVLFITRPLAIPHLDKFNLERTRSPRAAADKPNTNEARYFPSGGLNVESDAARFRQPSTHTDSY
jgi:UPF0716 family protein affecting phage T7 exclusion